MVDLTRDPHGRVHARLLDLVPGRSGKAHADWLTERGEPFRRGVKVAALDPFQGYKTAIDDKLEDAVAVLDAFHVVKLGTHAVDECRRRVQQQTLGHRGRKGDPLYGIQNLLRAGAEKLTDKQWARLETAIAANQAHLQVYTAWSCAQQLRAAYRHHDPDQGRTIATKILHTVPSCPIPEIARLGRTLKRWREVGHVVGGAASQGSPEPAEFAQPAGTAELRIPAHHRDRVGQLLAGRGFEPGEAVHRDDFTGVAPGLRAGGPPASGHAIVGPWSPLAVPASGLLR